MDRLNDLVGLNEKTQAVQIEDEGDSDIEIEEVNFTAESIDDDFEGEPAHYSNFYETSTSQQPTSTQICNTTADDELSDLVPQNEIAASRKIHREIRKLRFQNPGELMQVDYGDRRARRAVVQLQQQQKTTKEDSDSQRCKRIQHNKHGQLCVGEEEPVLLCDCLKPQCSGCWWPCNECESRRCSFQCQRNRKIFVAQVENPLTKGAKPTVNPYVSKEILREIRKQAIKCNDPDE